MNIEQFESILNSVEIEESSKSLLVEAYRHAIEQSEDREGRIKSIRDQNSEAMQAQIDHLTAQNLQLRLIADRAVVFLLAGSVPDKTDMDDMQLGNLNEYLDTVKYDDLEEAESTEDAFNKMLIRPLLSIPNGTPDAVNLLELAMAEQNRKKLVDEEIGQLTEFAKLRPQFADDAADAANALFFARHAGTIAKEKLFALFSPVVLLTRRLIK